MFSRFSSSMFVFNKSKCFKCRSEGEKELKNTSNIKYFKVKTHTHIYIHTHTHLTRGGCFNLYCITNGKPKLHKFWLKFHIASHPLRCKHSEKFGACFRICTGNWWMWTAKLQFYLWVVCVHAPSSRKKNSHFMPTQLYHMIWSHLWF